jgi:nucleoid-associated protein YgaU
MTRPRPAAPPAPTLGGSASGSNGSGDWGAAPKKSGMNAVVRFGLVLSLAAAGGLGYLVYDKLNKAGTQTAATDADAGDTANADAGGDEAAGVAADKSVAGKDGGRTEPKVAKSNGREPERMTSSASSEGVEDLFGGSLDEEETDSASMAGGALGPDMTDRKTASAFDPAAGDDTDLDTDLIGPATPTSSSKPRLKSAGVPLDVSMDEEPEEDFAADETIDRGMRIAPAKQPTKSASRWDDQAFDAEDDKPTLPARKMPNRSGAPKKGDKRLEGWEIDELRAAAEAAQAAAEADGITAAHSASAGSVTRVSAPVEGQFSNDSVDTLDGDETVPLSGPGSEDFEFAGEGYRSTHRPVRQPSATRSDSSHLNFEDPVPGPEPRYAERPIRNTVNGIDNSAYRAAATTRVRTHTVAPTRGEYVIEPGDSFWSISRKVYGHARYFRALEKFNSANIVDPAAMRPGMRILTPSSDELERAFPQLIESRNAQPAESAGSASSMEAGGRRRLAAVEPLDEGVRTAASRSVAMTAESSGLARDGSYRVGENDSFWSISKRVYGTARYFQALEKHNSKWIADPSAMRPGVVIHTPTPDELERAYPDLIEKRPANPAIVSASETTPYSASGRRRLAAVEPAAGSVRLETTRTEQRSGYFEDESGRPMYRVGSDDTLTGIAHQFLGRASRWTELFELNRDRMKDENTLVPGTVLRLPVDAGGSAFESDAEPH